MLTDFSRCGRPICHVTMMKTDENRQDSFSRHLRRFFLRQHRRHFATTTRVVIRLALLGIRQVFCCYCFTQCCLRYFETLPSRARLPLQSLRRRLEPWRGRLNRKHQRYVVRLALAGVHGDDGFPLELVCCP